MLRRFAEEFDHRPDGFEVDLPAMASAMGLSFARGANSPFGRALQRCAMFGLAQPMSDGFCVRRRLPQVAKRHLYRLPEEVRAAHDSWLSATVRLDVRKRPRHAVAIPV